MTIQMNDIGECRYQAQNAERSYERSMGVLLCAIADELNYGPVGDKIHIATEGRETVLICADRLEELGEVTLAKHLRGVLQ